MLALILFLHPCEMSSIKTVNVLIPKIGQISGHYTQNHPSHKLTIKILENFSKKFKLNIEYIFTNKTLHEVLENDEHSKNMSSM